VRRAIALAVWLLLGSAAAQLNLLVNGIAVDGATTALVTDITYVPAEGLAAAIGAELRLDRSRSRILLTLGATIVQGDLVENPTAAATSTFAWSRDGEVRPGTAALLRPEGIYLPVKAVGEAFGGRVTFLGESSSVVLVLPRPTLALFVEGGGAEERLRVLLSAPTSVSSQFDPASRVLEVRFDRTDVPVRTLPPLSGDGFRAIELIPSRGQVSLRVELPEGRVPQIVALPAGAGMHWLLALVDPGEAPPSVRAHWVLDADHKLERDAAGEATRAFVDRLAEVLAAADLEVERTRPGPAPVSLADRSAMGIGVDGFVSVYAADLPAGHVRVYALGEATGMETLARAIRFNAVTALPEADTDSLRRSLLLRLVPDLARGETWAEGIAASLTRAGWSVEGPWVAPLAVLAGAAGRGVVLEISYADLPEVAVVEQIARALLLAWPPLP
jgi:hypothetical protein